MPKNNVSFSSKTYDPKNAYRQSTTAPAGIQPSGVVNTHPKRVPYGSQDTNGNFKGDFRGIGITNPWGCKKSKKNRKSKKV